MVLQPCIGLKCVAMI